MKKFCKNCDHRCHCVGEGYYVNVDKCDACICERCECGLEILGAPNKKGFFAKLWQKYVDWIFLDWSK